MKRYICCILILSLVFFSGCVEKSVQSNKNEEVKNYIVYNMGKSPKDLVMLDNYDIREQDLLSNIFEGLVKVDESGKIVPGLCENWSVSKDETSYIFKIRENAKWSNGNDITADDFVDFFSEILNKNQNSIHDGELYYIFGANQYSKGKTDFSNVAIKAIDKKNLQIRLNYPCNYILNILSEPVYSLRKIDNNLVEWKKNYKDILYSGAFKIDNISQDEEIILKRNENYWNKDLVKSDKISISCIDSSEAALAAFQNRKVDLFINPPVNEYKSLVNNGSASKVSNYKTSSLVFNLKKEGIVKDINFRKAVAFNIDRNTIVKEILNDTAESALYYIPPNISNGMGGTYMNKKFFISNSEKAKAVDLMKKVNLGNSGPLKLIYTDSVENKKICEDIAKNLYNNLKLEVQCEGYSANEFNDELKKDNYDIAKIDYSANYDYPLAFLERWMSLSNLNFYGYKNSKFDDAVVKSRMENDKNKKIELLKDAEDDLLEDMIVVPLYFSNNVICKKGDIEGVYITKNGNVKLESAYRLVRP